MNDISYWCVFFSAAFALNIAPGPDLLFVLSRTVAQGKKVGLASAAGVSTGALVHVAAAAFGLSALLATSAVAFSLVKYAGACYLLYLGISALRSGGTRFDMLGKSPKTLRPWQAFRQGVFIDVLNPKVAIFFMAFLPQFVRPGHGSVSMQLLILGLLVIAVAVVVDASFVLAAARTTGYFRHHPKMSQWLDRLLGSIFIGLGIRLALTDTSS